MLYLKRSQPFLCSHTNYCFLESCMPVSVTNSKLIYDALKACDVKIMSALPETWLVHLIRMADEDPDVTLVRLAKEEEGIGISAGAHLATNQHQRYLPPLKRCTNISSCLSTPGRRLTNT